MVDDPPEDRCDVVILGREDLGHTLLLEPSRILVGNDAAHHQHDVVGAGLR